MPSWKKVITSGSNAALNSLTVSNGITSSLFGTASWAVSASQAITASYANFALTASNSQNAQDILIYVKNTTGAQINKGKVVRISGATGDNALISTASYESDPVSANTLGITYQNIPNDSFGYVITEGTLLGIDTDAFSAGQLLYLGAAGSIIGTAPVAPLHGVRLGQVLRVQQNNGSMYVRIDNGYELGELHDVLDTSTTSSYGDLLVKSGSVWTNSRQLTGSYGLTGSLNATSFVGALAGNATTATTASHALTASSINPLYQDVELHGNLVVYGTSSFTYVTSSQLAVDDSYISVNVFEPAERFGGIKVYDSGSSTATASLSWDSLHNHWVYSNASGSTYSGGMFMSGPRNTGSLGDEPTLTKWMVARSDGGDHLENTQIYSSASITQVTGSLTVTQGVTGSLQGTASYATQALSASFTVSSSRAVSASMAILAPSYLPLAGGTMTGDIYAAGRTFQLQDLVLGVGTTFGTIKTDGGKYIGVYPTNGVESTRFLANGHVLFQNGGTYTDKGYRLQISASNSISGALQVTGNSVMTGSLIVSQGITGSLFGTASWASNAVTASFLDSTTNAFVQNGNSFGALALLGTNDNNSLALETSGSTRMFISSSGLVGIGTTSPTFNLQVVGTSYASSYMQTPIVYADSFQPFAASQDFVGKLRNSAYKFDFQKADGTSLVVISGSGNVGIGITAPTTPLHVSGTIHVQTSNGSTFYGQDSGGSYARTFGVEVYDFRDAAGATKVRINTSTGNVGIGTTSPIEKLHIVSTSGSAATYPIAIQNATSSIDAKVGIKFIAAGATTRYAAIEGIQEDGNNAIALGFITGQGATITEKMRIVPGGNVGIGTAAPLYKLDVVGNIRAYTTLIRRDTSAGSAFINYNESASGYWSVGMPVSSYSYIITDSNYGIDKLAITNGSTWGIGIGKTAPNARLDVSGSAIISGSFTVTPGTVREFQVNTTGVDIGNLITDTHTVTGSLSISGSVIATSLTGSLLGTASFATSASFASTASFLGSTTNAFVQNGNSFGTTALLGTNDNNSLALETNGTTRMFISSSGNVGIGTTSPSDKLDIAGGSIKLANGYKLYDGSTNDSTGLYWDSNQVNISGYSGIIFRSSNSQVASQTERMRITSAGNVGIGTTTPSASLHVYKGLAGTTAADRTTPLDVLVLESENTSQQEFTGFGQSIVFRGSTYNDATQRTLSKITHQINDDSVSTTRGSSLNFQLATGSAGNTLASRMYIDYAGNVGIGTTSPVSIGTGITTLDIQGSGAGGIAFGLSGTKNYIYGASTMYVEANTTAVFATNGSEKMRITSTGNVGIGTSSPTVKLDVSGSVNVRSAAPTITFDRNSSYTWRLVNGDGGTYPTSTFNVANNAGTSVATFLDSGNVGIGTTTPNAKLDVNGNAIITGSLVVTGRITAEEFHTEFVSSSIIYQSGSTKFGDSSDDVHQFTGSLRVNGSITGSLFGTASWAQNAVTASYTDVSSLGGFIQGGNSFGTTALLGTNDNNSLALETSGSTRMFISSSGLVGIGTTSPSTLLHVSGTAANPLTIERSTSNSNIYIQYKNATTSWYAGQTDQSTFGIGTNAALGASTVFNISSSGNVGIGTTAPAYRLQVDASGSSNSSLPLALTSVDTNNRVGILFASSSISAGKQHRLLHRVNTPTVEWLLGSGAGETATWRFTPRDDNNYSLNMFVPYNGGTTYVNTGVSQSLFSLGAGAIAAQHLNISSSGNIGIGITNPNEKLHVYGTSVGINIDGTTAARTYYNRNGSYIWSTGLRAGDTKFHIYDERSADRFVIDDSGNVGIGNTSPSNRLHVSATVEDYVAVIENLGTGTTKNGLWIKSDSAFTDSTILKVTGLTTDRPILQINPDQVRIGPGSIGQFDGTLFVTSSAATVANFVANNNSALFISGSGNVGIGTTTPNHKLDVSGSANITGSLNVGISTITANRIAASSAGANAVFTQATGSFTGAKYLYTVTSASNARTGEVMAVWNGTSVQYTDNSTLDIGSTTAVTASVSIVTTQAQFNMQTTNAGWTIKSQVTYL